MKLSDHFNSKEFLCPCCKEGLPDPKLVLALEDLRTALDNRPIYINSGCRCAKHNKEIGGSPNSQHLKGRAVDLWVRGIPGYVICSKAVKIPEFRGIGVAPAWIHLDIRVGNRAMWKYDIGGKVI